MVVNWFYQCYRVKKFYYVCPMKSGLKGQKYMGVYDKYKAVFKTGAGAFDSAWFHILKHQYFLFVKTRILFILIIGH